MSATKHTPMVIAAARELCRQHAVACEVNAEDCWNLYAADFLANAQRVLQAACAPDLLEALDGLMELERRGRFMPIGREWDAARAAIAKATGSAS